MTESRRAGHTFVPRPLVVRPRALCQPPASPTLSPAFAPDPNIFASAVAHRLSLIALIARRRRPISAALPLSPPLPSSTTLCRALLHALLSPRPPSPPPPSPVALPSLSTIAVTYLPVSARTSRSCPESSIVLPLSLPQASRGTAPNIVGLSWFPPQLEELDSVRWLFKTIALLAVPVVFDFW